MMELEVIRTLDRWRAIRDPWNDLLARSMVRVPFLRHEFLSAWWRHLGGCREWPHGELHVVIARQGGRLVAAAPLFAGADRDGRPVLALIGSAEVADYLDFLAEPAVLPEFAAALLDYLAGPNAPGWQSIELFNLPDGSPTRAELVRAAAARGLAAEQRTLATCQVAPLASDWEGYLTQRIDKRDRHEIRRKMRRAEGAGRVRWFFHEQTATLSAAGAEMLGLMAQHPEKREMLATDFQAMFLDVLLAAHGGGWLRLAFLEIDGEKAAGCIAFDFDNRLWIYNTGFNEQFRHLSPGVVLLGHLIQWAIGQGRTEIDFLRGEQDYKRAFGSQSRMVHSLSLSRAAIGGAGQDAAEPIAPPDDRTLIAGLGVAEILRRGEFPLTNHRDCEIVTCRMPDGGDGRLFCKFGPLSEPRQPACRLGVGYEAQVYDQLLGETWEGEIPRLHGAFVDETAQMVVLSLHCVEGATPLEQASQPKAGLMAAARWIARFHNWGERAAVPAFLHRYDTDFYRAWLSKAADHTRGLHERHPWLPELCERGRRRLPAILPPETIIHGEYQAGNLLVRGGGIVAVDWGSAALAAGEFDLANLTWGWDDDLAQLCEQQYCLIRWPEATPDDFPLRLAAARVFLGLRWLGDFGRGDDAETLLADVEELAPLAERFRALDR